MYSTALVLALKQCGVELLLSSWSLVVEVSSIVELKVSNNLGENASLPNLVTFREGKVVESVA